MTDYELPQALQAIGVKLNRAEETCRLVDRKIDEFLQTEKNNFIITKHLEDGGARFVFKISSSICVPPIIPILIGEVIHHLRSCFDHLVWALVIQNGKTPSHKLQFPTAQTKADYDKAVERNWVKGVSKDAADFIVRMQPYREGNPKSHTLSIIHKLDIIDKHRAILASAAAATLGDTIEVADFEEGVDIKLGPPQTVVLGSNKADLFWLELSPPQVQFNADLSVDLQIGLRDIPGFEFYPVSELLTNLVKFTEGVIVQSIPHFD